MQFADKDVVEFLQGVNSVRDGRLVSLSIREEDWRPVVELVFHVQEAAEGDVYRLELRNLRNFDYQFALDNTPQEIAFAKCLWTEEDEFYLSLDPWKESERFISEQDNDFFIAKSVKLTVS
jgi:hypothetical protein